MTRKITSKQPQFEWTMQSARNGKNLMRNSGRNTEHNNITTNNLTSAKFYKRSIQQK